MYDLKRTLTLGMGVFGMVSNLLLLLAVGRAQRGWHRLNRQLVGPIAGVDFLATFLVVLSMVLSYAIGNRELLESSWYCSYLGVPLQTLPVFSVVLVAVMSIDRCSLVVYGEGLSRGWGWLFISFMCLGAAGLKAGNALMYGLRPDPTMTYCQTFGSGTITKVNQHLSNFIFLSGALTITFSYLTIYACCRRNPVAFLALPKGYLLILVAYQTCLLPKFITSLWKLFSDKRTLPHFLIILSPIGFDLLYIVNPCLVFAFQAGLRKELHTLFVHPKDSDPLQLSSEPFTKTYP